MSFPPLPRSVTRVAVLSALLAGVLTAPALADDPPDFCVANPTSACPSAVAAANRASTFGGLQAELTDHGTSFDTVIVEPGTYSEAVDFTGPADVTVYGDPAGASVPVITSDGSVATVTEETGAGGLLLSHLAIQHTGSAGAAFTSANRFGLSDVDLASTGAAVVGVATGAETLTDVTATSTAAAGTATTIPLITLDTLSSIKLDGLDAEAQDRADGIVIRNGNAVAQDVRSLAHGTNGGKGGYAILYTGEAGASDLPTLELSHAIAQGGSFGIAALGANMEVDNSLATSDGDAPGVVTVGPDTQQPAFGPAAIASGAAATVDLANVTAYAVGSSSDGIVANSARGNADDDPFAYRAFIRAVNSIFRGGHLDVEATPEVGFSDPNDIAYRARIGTSYDNFATFAGPTDAILGDTTDQIDDPMFVNPAGGDFHVKNGSRTLGAGTTITDAETDLDGNPRPNPAGGPADLGAYESTGTAAGPGTPPAQFTPPGEMTNPLPTATATATPIATAAPSSVFSIVGRAVKGGVISYALGAVSAGRFTAKATTKIKVKVRVKKGKHHITKTKTKKVTFATASASVAAGGTAVLTLKPSKAAAKGLKHGKKETVTVALTFLPTGGKPATSTQTVSVKKK